MKKIAILVSLMMGAVAVMAQTAGQFIVPVKTAGGRTETGVTLNNGEVLGKAGGVPAAISLSSYLTSASAASSYVSLTGSYSNPAWLTGLAWSKLSGVPTEFTPAAHNQAWSTITSTPTTLAGYGIADAQPLDSDLTAIASLTTTSFGCGLLTQADAIAARSTLGLVIGTNVQAYDADLAAIASLSTTSFGRGLLTQADAIAARSTLGLVIGTNVQAYDADLAAIASLSTTSFGRGLLTQVDAIAARSTLGLVIGTNVQAQNSNLSTLALMSPTGFGFGLLELANAAALSAAHAHAFADLTSRPTTLAGYGITDAAAAGHSHALAELTNWPANDSGVLTNDGAGNYSWEPIPDQGPPFTDSMEVRSAGDVTFKTVVDYYRLVFHADDNGAGGRFTGVLTPETLTAGRTWSLPDASGTLAVRGANTFSGLQSFSGTTHAGLRLNNLTTTQRDAIASPQAGMIVWNSTTGRISVHDGSAWTSGMVRLSGDTMTGQLQITQGTIASSAPLNITQTWNSGTPGTGAFSMLTLNATLTNASSTSSGFLTCIRDGITRIFFDSGGTSYFGGANAGTSTFVIDTNNVNVSLRNNAHLNWMGDTYLYRDGTASNLQMGIDAASPVSQTFKAHDGSGSNIDGASLTLSGGRSTGTGDDGDVILRTTMTGSSGSSLNTPQTRQHIQARFVNLAEGTATNIASISLPSGRVTGGTATITIWASDGTDFQAVTRDVTFNAVNKAGVITTSAASGLSAAVVDSSGSGSLTATFDTSSSGNNLLLRINATSSLTQTILRARLVITALNGDDVQTVTPQ